jgi:RHS repeat-associated protein
VTEHVWDHRNRLVGVIDRLGEGGPIVQSVEYVYDSQNRWIARSLDPDGAGPEPATATYFVYDDLSTPLVAAGAGSGLKVGQIILQLDDSGRVTNRYLWGPAVDQILADEQLEPDGTTTVLWTLTDHLNTVRDLALHDPATGATTIVNHLVYDAFGRITTQTDPTLAPLFAFTARPLDPATGLQNNLNRWYDAQVGRWVSEDPIGFAARDANVYRYVGNCPTNATDPTGCASEVQTLLDLYAELMSQSLPLDQVVADLILQALILTRGDALRALGLIKQVRDIADNDVWASIDHFFQSWNARWVTDNFSAGFIADVFNDGYTFLKLFPYARENWLKRDDPNKPPSPPTWLQYRWGKKGAWAAFWFSNDLWPTSPEWKKFLKWLDDQY